MASEEAMATSSRQASGRRTLQRLRREAGYRSAKDFAELLGIPAPTYARYERQPESPDSKIPMKAAWCIADALGCSIDLIVGRTSEESDYKGHIQTFYDSLSDGSRERLDEYLRFIEYREHMIAAQGRWQ